MRTSVNWVFLISLLTIACDQQVTIRSEQIQTQAPINQNQTGWVVNNLSQKKIANLSIKYPESRVRVINSKHRIYEIYGLTKAQIAEEAKDSQIFRNLFFESQNLKRTNRIEKAFKNFNQLTVQSSYTLEQLDECRKNQSLPFAQIAQDLPIDENFADTIELGSTLNFQAKVSEENQNLRFTWSITHPKNSLMENSLVEGPNLQITPDTLGLITIVLQAQDKNHFCTFDSKTISITKNEEYVLPSEALDKLKSTDISQFHHLEELSAQEAWSVSKGEGQLVAIIDSGVNYNHPDLNTNLFININEIPNNGIDDDNNGFIDDYLGYDFINSDPYPFDDEGHGSHVTGIAAASTFGIANKSKYLAVKAMSPFGGDLASIIGAIYYSVDSGAKIINLSFGTYEDAHPLLIEAIEYAEAHNALIITAAGNGDPFFGISVNTDIIPNYPSSLKNENIISVAAKSNQTLDLAPYSNYGMNSVTVIAPGGDQEQPIFSSNSENPAQVLIQGLYGTSMASPMVAGIAALVWSHAPHLNYREVKSILTQSGVFNPKLQKYSQSSRYINALSSLQIANPILLSGFLVSN